MKSMQHVHPCPCGHVPLNRRYTVHQLVILLQSRAGNDDDNNIQLPPVVNAYLETSVYSQLGTYADLRGSSGHPSLVVNCDVALKGRISLFTIVHMQLDVVFVFCRM